MRNLPRPAEARRRLLDVGCGQGAFLAEMRRAGWDVQGIEPDSERRCASRGRTASPSSSEPLEETRSLPGSFDAVTMNHVIEHFHDPIEALRISHTPAQAGRDPLDRDAESRLARPRALRSRLDRARSAATPRAVHPLVADARPCSASRLPASTPTPPITPRRRSSPGARRSPPARTPATSEPSCAPPEAGSAILKGDLVARSRPRRAESIVLIARALREAGQ